MGRRGAGARLGAVAAVAAALGAGCAAPVAEAPRSVIRELPSTPCARLAWPVDAPVTSRFGRRDGRPHEGIDLGASDGTPVRAACAGAVAYAGTRLRGYGRLLILDHGGGLSTVYAHNEALLVAEGARVEAGQVVARSGHSGRVTAPHLHFEVRRDGRAVDPLEYLAPRAAPSGSTLVAAGAPPNP